MSWSLDGKLVVGISTRALFDLEEENNIFLEKGLQAYQEYQMEHENDVLKPGTAFPLVKALHQLNCGDNQLVEIIIMSRNSANTGLRIFNSIDHYGLDISRAVLCSGTTVAPYFKAFKTDLYLSADEKAVREALDAGVAAGMIIPNSKLPEDTEKKQIRIAFDGDAVIFSDESERIYQEKGLTAFGEYERENANKPLPEGPFAKLLKTISYVQQQFKGEEPPIRTALVTSRNAPAHERVIRTLRAWNVRIDDLFFLGGINKSEVLKAFGADIFFDDQLGHAQSAASVVPSVRVPNTWEKK